MTSPLSPEAVAQMVADREAGTPGPWRIVRLASSFDSRDSSFGISYGRSGNRLALVDGEGNSSSHNEPNARRIARLPDIEAAYLTLAAENATLRASEAAALERVAELEAALANPVAVHANMLRGTIANPTPDQIIHLYGVDALCKALAPMIVREALEPTEYERKVAQMKEDFPNGI